MTGGERRKVDSGMLGVYRSATQDFKRWGALEGAEATWARIGTERPSQIISLRRLGFFGRLARLGGPELLEAVDRAAAKAPRAADDLDGGKGAWPQLLQRDLRWLEATCYTSKYLRKRRRRNISGKHMIEIRGSQSHHQ